MVSNRRHLDTASVARCSPMGGLIKGRKVGRTPDGVTMTKGLYQHVRENWEQPKANQPHMHRQSRMAQWRREDQMNISQ